jgi:hypothetical protein
MKLVFKKDEDSQISVFQVVSGNEQDFSYVDMIKALIESKEMEEPEISEGFTDAETKSIKSMVTFINKEISTTEEPDSGMS